MAAPDEAEPGIRGQVDPPADAPRARPGRRRGLDRRTVAICVAIAAVAAIAAALVATVVLDDGDTAGGPGTGPSLIRAGDIDRSELFPVELMTADDQATTIEAYLGEQPLVVNLWARSCPPCIEEMPWLEQTRADNPEVRFLGVNVLDKVDVARQMATETGITYEWVRDPKGDFANAAKSSGLPDTILIDTDGTVLASKLGAFDSQADIQRWLDDHLPETG